MSRLRKAKCGHRYNIDALNGHRVGVGVPSRPPVQRFGRHRVTVSRSAYAELALECVGECVPPGSHGRSRMTMIFHSPHETSATAEVRTVQEESVPGAAPADRAESHCERRRIPPSPLAAPCAWSSTPSPASPTEALRPRGRLLGREYFTSQMTYNLRPPPPPRAHRARPARRHLRSRRPRGSEGRSSTPRFRPMSCDPSSTPLIVRRAHRASTGPGHRRPITRTLRVGVGLGCGLVRDRTAAH